MKLIFLNFSAMLALLTYVFVVWADDIHFSMETENAKPLSAFSTNTPSAFCLLPSAFCAWYTKDAVLMPPGI